MALVDRNVALEALSALTGSTVKNFTGYQGTNNPDQLNTYNFITAAILGQEILRSLAATGSALAALQHLDRQLAGNFSQNLRKELFVNMDEFFDPLYDCDFTHCSDKSVCWRGNEPYKRPCGWYRFALKVLNKYPDGNTWLGTDGWRSHSVAGEWPVSYHGTSIEGAKGIMSSHYKAGPNKVYGRGVYSTYDIEEAYVYCTEFTSKTNGKKYRCIMQNRINPKMRTQCNRRSYWLIKIPEGTSPAQEKEIVEKSMRPYGILLKQM
ncbi:uncharacterized protein [Misgurnus anguillicaudatus]|uniref:uncharacterized protein n=1 Tax=Misgurnus anguillicaudatus TaxID=75329 RepID=UPI003CCF5ABD